MNFRKLHSSVIVCAIGLALAMPGAWAADKPSRLKYRSKGSVCGCSSGMSEADISRSMAGLDNLQAQATATDKPTNSDNSSDQPSRRSEDGAGK
jgi:hypothetical protein